MQTETRKALVRTPSGVVTSWHHFGERSTSITWRTDGPEPFLFDSIMDGLAWVDQVWALETPKEKAKANWTVEEVD